MILPAAGRLFRPRGGHGRFPAKAGAKAASREGRARAGERRLRARSRFARGRREIRPQLALSGGPWGERIGPGWNSVFICH